MSRLAGQFCQHRFKFTPLWSARVTVTSVPWHCTFPLTWNVARLSTIGWTFTMSGRLPSFTHCTSYTSAIFLRNPPFTLYFSLSPFRTFSQSFLYRAYSSSVLRSFKQIDSAVCGWFGRHSARLRLRGVEWLAWRVADNVQFTEFDGV